jgi:glycosyltransferase involved in cell wall biosynthesis
MKYSILKVHNRYQQPGGEDESSRSETALLARAGHSVTEYVRDNDEITAYTLIEKVSLGPRTVWAWDSCRQLGELLSSARPDVAHFDNTFPLISPAVYYACQEAGVPVVQTLRNYRLLCPGATFQRDGRVCEDCLGRGPWRGVLHGCYRDSRGATAGVALMLSVHRRLGTWSKLVDCYIALTEFARAKFIEAGLPGEKIVVKQNFVCSQPIVSQPQSSTDNRRHASGPALFVGRLSREKGVGTLLAAWKRLGNRIPLHVVGDGPLRTELESFARQNSLSQVFFHGRLNPEQTLAEMKRSRFLVFPSEWYETFGRVAAEAFACGVPVIASRMGAMEEIVADGRTGLHFTPGNADDLARKVEWACDHPEEMSEMGRSARAEYEAKFTPERNYTLLMGIYDRAMESGQRSLSRKRLLRTLKGEACQGLLK